MEVFRLHREKYGDPLSGKGAAIKGARWNPVGMELIYTAANRSLAMAEVAVHFTLATLPANYRMITIFIPDDIPAGKLIPADLPANWNLFPHPAATQAIGEQFITSGESCILHIPSAVTQGDYNVLINPNHPDFSRVKVIETAPFPFDKRIFG